MNAILSFERYGPYLVITGCMIIYKDYFLSQSRIPQLVILVVIVIHCCDKPLDSSSGLPLVLFYCYLAKLTR